MQAEVPVASATASTPATAPRATREDVEIMLATIGEPSHIPYSRAIVKPVIPGGRAANVPTFEQQPPCWPSRLRCDVSKHVRPGRACGRGARCRVLVAPEPQSD